MFQSLRSFFYMSSLDQKECEIYCRKKRIERYEKYGAIVTHVQLHALAHRVLLPLMKADFFFKGQHLHILWDDRKKTEKPVIYCPTHIGGADVEMSVVAVKSPCWVTIGDPMELYKSLDGMLLQMNGYIALDVMEKEDRKAAKARMKALLEKKSSLLLFPEGTQNISPNAILGHLFAGAVELAILCGAEIVPLAIAREDKEYYVAIGENISYEGSTYEDRFALTDDLRDHMATLKWKLMEHFPKVRREDIPETAYEDLVHEVLDLNTEYSLTPEFILNARFQPKGSAEPNEVFAFRENLHPCLANAFLFDKRLRGW